ncbi:MAG TPA: serine/threonine-protein kinase [Sandaracinaceae bacterium LLY-WYZ-13_1]|nr:serine/threonine-protein kinase [Sandaracinaceae bacterium LLY-WYZ-13_1]
MSTARTVAERYALIRPIGRGLATVVYVARNLETGRDLALKLIPARHGLLPREVQTFQQDLGATFMVDHPGMVETRDAGFDPDGDVLYVAMELLHGESLREMRARSDAEASDLLDVLEQALEPLAAAHARGLVHGDLTPANVFDARRRDGERVVKILDLGLARILRERGLLAEGGRVGTPRYMAPEQLAGGRPTPATDVWAFGVMLHEAITGVVPFDYDHPDALAHHVCQAPHRPIEETWPEADEALAKLVDLCLEKVPARRPPDARAALRLMKTLRSGIGSMPRGSRADGGVMLDTVIDASGAAPPPPPEELEQALRRSPRDPQTHRALLAHYRDEDNADGVWLATTALVFLGEATREEIRLHHHYERPRTLAPDRGIDAGGWAALLHPDQDPRIDAVWTELVEAVAALHRRPDDALGLHGLQKLDVGRTSGELGREVARAVGALRPGAVPRIYRGRPGVPPHHVPATPPASVFPKGFEEPLPAGALAYAVGRHVAYDRASHRVCIFLSEPEALESVFDAGLRVGLGWSPDRPEQARMAHLLQQRMSEGKRQSLHTVCARLGTSARRVDLGTWRRAVELSCSRAGLLLSADLEGAGWMLRWNRERRRIPTEDAMDDLLGFWSSGAHVRLRHMLGLSAR